LLIGTDNGKNEYTQAGGVIAVVAPFVEVVTSQLKETFYDERKQQ